MWPALGVREATEGIGTVGMRLVGGDRDVVVAIVTFLARGSVMHNFCRRGDSAAARGARLLHPEVVLVGRLRVEEVVEGGHWGFHTTVRNDGSG